MPTRNGAVRVRSRRSGAIRRNESSPLQRRSVRRQAVSAGMLSFPNASQKICITTAFAVHGMCSGERFPGCAWQSCSVSVFAADFMLKSAHFVFWTKCAASSRNRLLFCPLCGAPVCGLGTRRPAYRRFEFAFLLFSFCASGPRLQARTGAPQRTGRNMKP